jgi:DNA-directed RNA polymerase subunit N (RpoN/RPB10)
MEQPHRCFECGNVLSELWLAINAMKIILLEGDIKNEAHVDKQIIDPEQNENILPIFQFLGVNKYCCRAHILTAVNMRDI